MKKQKDEIIISVASKKQLWSYIFIFITILIVFFMLGYYAASTIGLEKLKENIKQDLPRYCADVGCLCFGGEGIGEEERNFINFEV